jgi:hypothetical protein
VALSSPLFSNLDAQSENVEEIVEGRIWVEVVSKGGILLDDGVVGSSDLHISNSKSSVLSRSVHLSSESDSMVTGLGDRDAAFGFSEAVSAETS